MDPRHERLVRNETLFREVNERIEEVATHSSASADHLYDFLCECSNADCTLLLHLTQPEYEQARNEPDTFVVAPGHELPEIERVVSRTERYQLVKKHGEAAEFAEERDPRS
jgi:hypothetical protein